MTGIGSAIVAKAYAKINLSLNVLAREASGYHSIETIFHRLELADELHVSLTSPSERIVTCSEDVGPAEKNLAYRAAVAYLDRLEWNAGFTIHIEKRIPARGGLGGGSADAAATLRALNRLNLHPMPARDLLDVAASIGSDVPFLTSDAVMALAWGHGERMLALDPLPQRWVALVVPMFGVDTGQAYGWLSEDRTNHPDADSSHPQHMLMHSWHLSNWNQLRLLLPRNDFTPAVSRRHPEIGLYINALRGAGAFEATMSGSGSTVFGLFESRPDEAELADITGCRVIVTRTATGVESERSAG